MAPRIILLGALLAILSCTTIGLKKNSEKNLRSLRLGMTDQAVVESLGEPESKMGPAKKQVWHYRIESQDHRQELPYVLSIVNSKLAEIRFDTNEANELKKNLDSIQPTDCGFLPCGPTGIHSP